MFKIKMYVKRTQRWIDMPNEVGLDMFEAMWRVGLYSRRNRDCRYAVVNEFTGDIEYETE